MKRINDMMYYFEARISECEENRARLISDGRADEADFEKIRANIFDVFKTVHTAAQKACGGDLEETGKFFLSRLQQIPSGWYNALQKAQQYGDAEKILIESIKIEASEEIRSQFVKIWEG